jgi:hypothetical protein
MPVPEWVLQDERVAVGGPLSSALLTKDNAMNALGAAIVALIGLGYRYIETADSPANEFIQNWAKSEDGGEAFGSMIFTVTAVSPTRRDNPTFRITVQNSEGTHVVAVAGLTASNISERMSHYECCLLNGIESLTREL